ncbi:MAG: hypothetical protein M0021_04795 [Clostridia bacterium]|nr:hypothetical protein [Clostridia bacterium]
MGKGKQDSGDRLYNNEFTYEDLGSATQVKLDAKSQPDENVAAKHLKTEQSKARQAEKAGKQ